MPVKIKMPSAIKAKLGIDPNGRVQRFVTNTFYKHMDKYVPKNEGNLRTVVDIQPTSITYEMPYAAYQYYGIRQDGTHRVQKYTTVGTGPYWDKRMVSGEIDDIVKEVQNFVNRGGK